MQPILGKVWCLSLTTGYTLQVNRYVTGQPGVQMTTLGFLASQKKFSTIWMRSHGALPVRLKK